MTRGITLLLALAIYCFALSHASKEEKSTPKTAEECAAVPAVKREQCGDHKMEAEVCIQANCCFDPASGRCFHGGWEIKFYDRYPAQRVVGWGPMSDSKPVLDKDQNMGMTGVAASSSSDMINIMTILQMKKDGVSKNIINALLADSIPNGELLYYMSDGKLDASEMMALQGVPELDLEGYAAIILKGGSVKDMLYEQLGSTYGMDPVIMKLLMAGESDVVKEHLLTKMISNLPSDPMSRLVIRSLATGVKLTKQGIMDVIIDDMLATNFDAFTSAAFKAILAGDKETAKMFLFLGQMKGMDFKPNYPQNEALFARMVDLQKTHPKKINPTMIFSLAMNEKIPALTPQKTFQELFGVTAFDYVCAVHSPKLQMSCRALVGKTHASSLDCFNAGCCLRDDGAGGKPICYENLLGNIGIGMAAAIWDEDYIVNNIFGGNLPDLAQFYPDGIPWIVSTTLPAFATAHTRLDPAQANWWDSLNPLGYARVPNPTAQPLIKPDAFNPGFQWVPHGVTPHPFPTQAPDLPPGLPAVTSAPGAFGGVLPAPVAPVAPVVQQLLTNTFPGCFTVPASERIPCMGNEVAWAAGGDTKCAAMGCCFNKDITDPSVPACFSSMDRGQCHNIPPEEKIDCGAPGITSDECLSDPRCCYDSTTVTTGIKTAPWCYYKKYAFLPEEIRCSAVVHTARVGCFPKKGTLDMNHMVSQSTCEAADCCYEKVTGVSFLHQALGLAHVPPPCFQKAPVLIGKPEAPPAPPVDPPTTPKCQYRDELDPAHRVDCGASTWHECVIMKECCYQVETMLQGVPFCFMKTEL